MKIAIVTGASSGLGKDFVMQLAHDKRIREIWVIARRSDRLEELEQRVNNKRIRVLPLDLLNKSDRLKYKEILSKYQPDVKVMVNGAGFGKLGTFMDISEDDNNDMVALNCEALVHMSQITIPYMSNHSQLIQIASMASAIPQPGMAVYAASKSFVLSFSRALRWELKPKGIHVIAVCPGPVRTEFWEVASETGPNPYRRATMADSKQVVRKALRDAYADKDVSIYGIPMKLLSVVAKVIPHKFMLPILTKWNL